MRVATDTKAPASQRLHALQPLAGLVHEHSLSPRRVTAARRADPKSGVSFFPEGGPQHVRVAQLLLGAGHFTRQEAVDCAVLMRHPDAEVRELAVQACALSLQEAVDPALEGAYVGGLFDPIETVARVALAASPTVRLEQPASRATVDQRTIDLVYEGSKTLRATAASVLAVADSGGAAKRARSHARSDSSWIVRRAASGRG